MLVACGAAEALPFASAAFDYVLVATTLCFVGDPGLLLREAVRVLGPRGQAVVAFIDRDSALAQEYSARRAANLFYRDARFYSAAEVESLLKEAGLRELAWVQTLRGRRPPARDVEPLAEGTGLGAFVVVRGRSR